MVQNARRCAFHNGAASVWVSPTRQELRCPSKTHHRHPGSWFTSRSSSGTAGSDSWYGGSRAAGCRRCCSKSQLPKEHAAQASSCSTAAQAAEAPVHSCWPRPCRTERPTPGHNLWRRTYGPRQTCWLRPREVLRSRDQDRGRAGRTVQGVAAARRPPPLDRRRLETRCWACSCRRSRGSSGRRGGRRRLPIRGLRDQARQRRSRGRG